jgi:Flp pilus assembly protein TadD
VQAEAQYYNNLGADALVDFELSTAYAYFRKALETDPNEAYVWSNLGVVLRRNGQTDDAIFAYETALKIDPDLNVALNNLYTIHEEDENFEAAQQLERRVERNRRKNPYYLHHLAEIANEEQRYSDAVTLLNRAIRIKENEYRFHYTLAQSQSLSGNPEIAEASLDRARQLAPPNLRTGPLTLPDGRQ